MSTGSDTSRHHRHWRWYKSPSSGRVVAKEEFDGLALHGQAALAEAIGRFRKGEELPNEVEKLKNCDGMWEIRVRVNNQCFRALFFYDTDVITCVCVTTFFKNSQKTPERNKKTAKKRKKEWEAEGRRRSQREN